MNKNILNDLIKNVSCQFSNPLMHIKNSGIELYDPYSIEEPSDSLLRSNSHLPSNKTLFYHQKSSLDHTLNESQNKTFAKSFEYASKAGLSTLSLKKLDTNPIKKRKSSNHSWSNKQLIKVYGMRYEKSVRNSKVFIKNPKKLRAKSTTPSKLK